MTDSCIINYFALIYDNGLVPHYCRKLLVLTKCEREEKERERERESDEKSKSHIMHIESCGPAIARSAGPFAMAFQLLLILLMHR